MTYYSNYIVDLHFKTPIKDSAAAGKKIAAFEGVVEHGLFLDMTTAFIGALDEAFEHVEAVIKLRIPGLQSLINKTISDLETELSRLGKPIATDVGSTRWR